MDTSTVVLIIVVVLALAGAAAAIALSRQRRRTQELRSRFGPEYDRTVQEVGRRREAERQLAERRSRYQQLQRYAPLPPERQERYQSQWLAVQARFVDSPDAALGEADTLVTELMTERGFPTDSVSTQEEVLSVEHGKVLASFRAGHAVQQDIGSASTEQVRQAMLHFRAVFDELLNEGPRGGSQQVHP